MNDEWCSAVKCMHAHAGGHNWVGAMKKYTIKTMVQKGLVACQWDLNWLRVQILTLLEAEEKRSCPLLNTSLPSSSSSHIIFCFDHRKKNVFAAANLLCLCNQKLESLKTKQRQELKGDYSSTVKNWLKKELSKRNTSKKEIKMCHMSTLYSGVLEQLTGKKLRFWE